MFPRDGVPLRDYLRLRFEELSDAVYLKIRDDLADVCGRDADVDAEFRASALAEPPFRPSRTRPLPVHPATPYSPV